MAGIDLSLDDARRGTLTIDSNIVSGNLYLEDLEGETAIFDGGGLGRQLSVYRLPEADWNRRVVLDHQVTFAGNRDLPVYLRVTEAHGHQACCQECPTAFHVAHEWLTVPPPPGAHATSATYAASLGCYLTILLTRLRGALPRGLRTATKW